MADVVAQLRKLPSNDTPSAQGASMVALLLLWVKYSSVEGAVIVTLT